jgi:Helicase conserved C-terminal domain
MIVVDEAHSIADGSRGILLHTVIEELLTRRHDTQIIFASPITRNLSVFARSFGINDITNRSSREPAVSQNFLVIKSDSWPSGRMSIGSVDHVGRSNTIGSLSSELSLRTKVQKLAHIPLTIGRGQSSLIYANGPDEAERVALTIAKSLSSREPTSSRVALSKLSSDAVHEKYVLADCVLKGVGFHYANIPTIVRQEIENAFWAGDLDYLVCTSTLLQGVNLPAKNLFVLNPTKGQNTPIEPADFWNLAGRAGRLRQEFQGNIFLIDYEFWPKKVLSGPKDTTIIPAIESTVKARWNELMDTIQTDERRLRKRQIDLDTAFVRLFSDMKDGVLARTLTRSGIGGRAGQELRAALELTAERITLPSAVLRHTPNVSVHKQQELYLRIRDQLRSQPSSWEQLVPLHPSEAGSFQSYASILELCHEVILGYDVARKLYRFYALMAWRWMRGWPIPRIIAAQIKRHPQMDIRRVIRDTLDLIETEIRFQTVTLFACYNAILEFALSETGHPSEAIPEVPLFLEVGASNNTMVSFIALGLSRAAAIRLNGWCSSEEQEMNSEEAMVWLRSRAEFLDELELPELLLAEVRAVLQKQSN